MFNRRIFLKKTAALGAVGLVKPVFAQQSRQQTSSGFFNIHPFVGEHPEAVFIMLTDVDMVSNYPAKKEVGLRFARSVMMPVDKGGIPLTSMIPIKPNLTASLWDNKGFPLEFGHGIVTDPYFVEGVIESMKELGLSSSQFYIREVNGPECFGPRMYIAMCERTGADIRDLSTDVREMPKENIQWMDVPDGRFHTKIPYLWPVNAPGTFYLNIAKFKNNMNGMTLTCKNHQGAVGSKYQRFCNGNLAIDGYHHEYLVPDVKKKLEASYKRHLEQGLPLWDRGYKYYSFENTIELWCQRTLDNISTTNMGLCIVEAIHGREGCFHRGPNPPRHNDRGLNEARDFMTNFILFGKDPILVDIVGHWLAGHEPGNFGFFHIAMERGMSTLIDPRKIPVYVWKDGAAERVPLEMLQRTPIRSNYLPKNPDDDTRATIYYMYDEPFDYSKINEKVASKSYNPGTRVLDTCRPNPSNPYIPIEYTLPKSDYVCIDIADANGRHIDRILKGYHEKGPGCAVWNIRNCPSGTYHYTFQTRDYEETKDIVLKT